MDPFGGALLSEVFGELLKLVIEAKKKSDKYKDELAKLKSTLDSITPVIQEIERLNIALTIPEQETAKLKEELIKGTELVRKCSDVKTVKCCCFKTVNYADKLIKLCFKTVNYADKLIKLNQSIERICQVDMLTQLIRDNKKILVKVEEIGVNMQTDDKKILEQVDMQTELIRDNKKILEQVEERGVNMQTDNKKILVGVNATLSILRRNEKGGGNQSEIDELCSVPEPPEITPGLDASLEELRKELVNDNGMRVIVITAPGGYGKTTLVKNVELSETFTNTL